MSTQEKDQKQTTGTFPINDFTGKAIDQRTREELSHLLSGSLREKPIAWLLQAAGQKEVSGQLLIGTAMHMTTIQLVNGKPIHAQSKSSSGTEAILELFVRDDAKVKFEDNSQPTHATIKSPLDELFSLGHEYKSSLLFLTQNDIDESARLIAAKDTPRGLSKEEMLSQGFELDIPTQIKFLQSLSGTISIKDVALRLSLQKSKTMIICANLLRLGLALTPRGQSLKSIHIPGNTTGPGTEYDEEEDFPGEAGDEKQPEPTPYRDKKPTISYFSGVPPVEIGSSSSTPETHGNFMEEELSQNQVITSPSLAEDNSNNAPKLVSLGTPKNLVELESESAGARALGRLKDSETGVLDKDAFQFFLEFQFARSFRFGTSFSLVTFSIITDAEGRGILPVKDLAKLLGAVDCIKRDVDVFGQLGDRVFAFILPNVESEDATHLARRILSDLDEKLPELTVWRPELNFGIASIPVDARDLANLVKNAQLALFEACKSEDCIIQYKDMQNRR